MNCQIIAHIETDFNSKFGVPRQAGLVPELLGQIVFQPAFRVGEALRGLEGFSHLWLIWVFSEVAESMAKDRATNSADGPQWSPTVRPPRLGGNKRMGVFATRSPFRPNPIGLSCVEIAGIEFDTPRGPIIHVRGADLMNGTPILDIKPYLPFTDSHPEARGGFADLTLHQEPLKVEIPEELYTLYNLKEEQWMALRKVLSQDPRPHYHHDADRIYGITFAGIDIHFKVIGSVVKVLP